MIRRYSYLLRWLRIIFCGVLCILRCVFAESAQVEPAGLDRAIEQTLANPVYAWRLPREARTELQKEMPGFLKKALQATWTFAKKVIIKSAKILKKIGNWIGKLFPERNNQLRRHREINLLDSVNGILITLGVILAGIIIFLLFRMVRQSPATNGQTTSNSMQHSPDLTDENVRADELPFQDWLRMADRCLHEGEHRLAVRAQFLSLLAFLGECRFLRLVKSRTNSEYQRQLYKRTRSRPEMYTAFASFRAVYDAIWYGSRPVSEADAHDLHRQVERIYAHDR
ncbi:MAG: DUF4129 domain-containing protein [Chitinivibrionales bacterium]|nr:DUF4129 domain-containing protein [Chitinivibrionales bacterium]